VVLGWGGVGWGVWGSLGCACGVWCMGMLHCMQQLDHVEFTDVWYDVPLVVSWAVDTIMP
jgi:hypothetical protein